MKYFIAVAVAVIAAAGTLWLSRSQPQRDAHAEWKYTAVEKEVTERPAKFEAMKFTPGSEVRAPASDKKSSKK